MSQINFNPNITQIGPAGKTGQAAETTKGESPEFGKILKDSIAEVNRLQADADKAIEALSTGKTDNVAEVMTAVQKADLAFKTLLQIRNKLLDAYNEVRQMRM